MLRDQTRLGLSTAGPDFGEVLASLPVRLALAWITGILFGSLVGSLYLWLGVAGLTVVFGAFCWHRMRRAGIENIKVMQVFALAGLVCISAGWYQATTQYTGRQNIERFMPSGSVGQEGEPALAIVQGTIASVPRDVIPDQGSFGAFNFRNPGTLFELKLQRIDVGQGLEPVEGAILVRIKEHDHRPKLGQQIEATGWLSAIGPTQNPGEFDYRAYLQREGISGRMTLMRRDNWMALSDPPRWTLTGIRRAIGDTAASSLSLGLPHDAEQRGLLEALLLGRRGGDIKDLTESFRAVGLAHILSISGAHLGILLVIVWWIGRLSFSRPAWVAGFVLLVLVLFLLAVPWRTPIVRAGIMAGVFCCGFGLGRRMTGADLLAASALIVLIWKPTDLFDAGFQLSFGVVGALLMFTRPLSRRILPESDVTVVHPSPWDIVLRRMVDLTAVSLVAFFAALPVVMYHFKLVSPLAALLSILALLPLTVLLGLGYFKILVGLVLPTAGVILAMPLSWMTDSLVSLVERSSRLPVASIELARQPTVVWTLAAVVGICAMMGGMLSRRRAAMAGVIVLLLGWAWLDQNPQAIGRSGGLSLIAQAGQEATLDQGDEFAALTLNMFAVGDGSCFLLRCDGYVLMFDCGSQAFLRIGERSVVPALMELGVSRIDVLMLSHADLDHFVGVLDVLDAVEVAQVCVSPDVMREAAEKPNGATAFLVAGLRQRGFEPVVIERGWTGQLGRARLDVLWPAAGYVDDKNNNHSLVLRAKVGDSRLLLNGDIQQEAIMSLLEMGEDLRADVTDLAHHGSFVEASPRWIKAVDPRLVLQSSGWRRPEQDQWRDRLAELDLPRLASDRLGMVELQLTEEGRITWASHRGTSGRIDPAIRE